MLKKGTWIGLVKGRLSDHGSNRAIFTLNTPCGQVIPHPDRYHFMIVRQLKISNDWLTKIYYSQAFNSFWLSKEGPLEVFNIQATIEASRSGRNRLHDQCHIGYAILTHDLNPAITTNPAMLGINGQPQNTKLQGWWVIPIMPSHWGLER